MRVGVERTARLGFCDAHSQIAADFSRQAFCIQGLLCDAVTIEEAKQYLMTCMREGRRCNLATPNANFLRLIRSDPSFRDALLASDLSVIDGMPLVWFARALGITVPGRVCGSDLCVALMAEQKEQFRTFFFGATEEIGQRVRQRLEATASGLRFAGACSPGFGTIGSMSDPGTFDNINRVHSDLLIVAIGARKGVVWLARNEHQISTPVICNLGATINFVAGTVKRAPAVLQRYGLEWLWRMKEEPALWSRYARDLATLGAVLTAQILPCIVFRALYAPRARLSAQGWLRHRRSGTTELLEFSGAWTNDNLAPVRAALSAATRKAEHLVIDLERVTFVDAAFLGQLLLAYGYQRRMQRSVVVRATSRRIRRMLRMHGCSYLAAAPQEPDRARVTAVARGSADGREPREPHTISSHTAR
jgi:N-acetylglucosaminyldiphosphoundecaprenol N-acetyl-beta-D-mannosaminyltransferase